MSYHFDNPAAREDLRNNLCEFTSFEEARDGFSHAF